MIMTSGSTWPPRRLGFHTRLMRLRLRWLGCEILLPTLGRLALWTGWLVLTGATFLGIDIYL
jgi:hypothetical protein